MDMQRVMHITCIHIITSDCQYVLLSISPFANLTTRHCVCVFFFAGDIAALVDLDVGDFDAVVFPGGFGAAKNLSYEFYPLCQCLARQLSPPPPHSVSRHQQLCLCWRGLRRQLAGAACPRGLSRREQSDCPVLHRPDPGCQSAQPLHRHRRQRRGELCLIPRSQMHQQSETLTHNPLPFQYSIQQASDKWPHAGEARIIYCRAAVTAPQQPPHLFQMPPARLRRWAARTSPLS